jgi:hypothetical protein
VDIDLNPATMIEGGSRLDQGQVIHPWALGMFTRSADAHGLPEQGDIWAYKLGWWNEVLWDIVAYAKNHSTYPCDASGR